jgi:3-oxoacyl-[acyl-carrier protein] reductase
VIAVVTGGGRGIGRAIARAFAGRGLDVALLGRSSAHLEEAAGEVRALGARALTRVCDVSRAADVARAAEAVATGLGVPRVLVNNAGVVRRVPLLAMTEADWDAVVDVNLKGTFLATRAFLPSMCRARTGRVVMLGSISGSMGTPRLTAYCASKWGTVGFTKALAEELRGTGLQAMCVMPGSVDTEMLAGSGFPPQMSPDDVARVVAWTALDAPDALNGSAVEMFGP